MRSKAASVSIAVSVMVMIVAMAVASGFRTAIYGSLSDLFGDITVEPYSYGQQGASIDSVSYFSELVSSVGGVAGVRSVISRPGVLKSSDQIHGVLFKGLDTITDARHLVIPSKLKDLLEADEGDKLLGYFVSDRVSVRNFELTGTYDAIVTDDDKLVVFCSNSMLARVCDMEEDQAASLEVMLEPSYRGEDASRAVCEELSFLLYEASSEDGPTLVARTVRQRYSKLFGWLGMVDTNVDFILLLMTLVAAFNMVSALLILLFQNINTIGVLKTLGMSNRGIAATFLHSSGRAVLISMLCGNLLALAFCFVQDRFHVIGLNPDNYFVSYVPVHVDAAFIMSADIAAFVVIMLILLVPCAFISRVEAARSVDYR